jgi:hypothetical protein
MANYQDPLSDAFDIDDDSFIDATTQEIIDIPEIKELEFTIARALIDYKEIKEVIQLVEPKNRLKYFELARDFLDLSKDAMFKRDSLILKREEMMKRHVANSKNPQQTETLPNGDSGGKLVTREELEAQRKLKAVQTSN